jgi:hypothetical protein
MSNILLIFLFALIYFCVIRNTWVCFTRIWFINNDIDTYHDRLASYHHMMFLMPFTFSKNGFLEKSKKYLKR